MLRERNRSYGTIKFVDIGSDDYSPDENQNIDYETVSLRSTFCTVPIITSPFFLRFSLTYINLKLYLVKKN